MAAADSSFGTYLWELRHARRWTLRQLATRSSLSYTYLSRLENNRASPSLDAVVALAEALDGDLRTMIERAGCLPPAVARLLETSSPEAGLSNAHTEDGAAAPATIGRPIVVARPDDGFAHAEAEALTSAVLRNTRAGSDAREVLLRVIQVVTLHSEPPSSNLPGAVADYHPEVDYFPDKVRPCHARGWTVRYEKNYKVVTVGTAGPASLEQPETYLLVQRGTPPPPLEGELAGAQLIPVPVARVWDAGHALLAAVEFLGVADAIVGWSYRPTGITYLPRLAERVDQIETLPLDLTATDDGLRTIASHRPDVYFEYGSDGRGLRHAAGIPAVYYSPWAESPLGSAEQLKFLALFFNLEAKANALFEGIERRYLAIRGVVKGQVQRPRVLIGRVRDGRWHTRYPESMLSQLVREAGGADILLDQGLIPEGPLREDRVTLDVEPPFEAVLASAVEADFWYSTAYDPRERTIEEFIAAEPLNARFPPLLRGDMIHAFRRGEDIFETGGVRVDFALADLVSIFYPSSLPDHQLVFHTRVY